LDSPAQGIPNLGEAGAATDAATTANGLVAREKAAGNRGGHLVGTWAQTPAAKDLPTNPLPDKRLLELLRPASNEAEPFGLAHSFLGRRKHGTLSSGPTFLIST
jgi:hypothetical protein